VAGLFMGIAAWPASAEDAPAPSFLGTPDDEILKRLCQQEVVKLDLNHQGTTIKFKVTLSDGTRGSLRPAQQSEAGNHRADAAGFGHYAGVAVRRNEKQLDGVERFSRGFIAALRRVDDAQLAAALEPAGLRPISLRHVSLRRAWLLRRVDELIAKHGEAKVL